MKFSLTLIKFIFASFFLIFTTSNMVLAGSNAHIYLGFVSKSASDTPEKRGYMSTALRESLVAAAHASYTADAIDDLGDMQLHVGHVLHAIDPTEEPFGPGLGYGLIKAAQNVIESMTLAVEGGDASRNLKLHAKHIIESSQNAINRTRLALIEADAILEAEDASEAAPHAIKFAEHTKAAFIGMDLNGDGKISWKNGEGGLKTADKHLGLLLDGEGLKR